MRRRHLWLVVFLAGAAIGAWAVTNSAKPAQTVRVEGPESPQTVASLPPALADPSASAVPLSGGVSLPPVAVNLNNLCPGPPAELTEEQKRLADEILSKAPLPPTVTPTTPGGVINVLRPLVPC